MATALVAWSHPMVASAANRRTAKRPENAIARLCQMPRANQRFASIDSMNSAQPAMAAGVSTRLFDVSDLAAMPIEAESENAA